MGHVNSERAGFLILEDRPNFIPVPVPSRGFVEFIEREIIDTTLDLVLPFTNFGMVSSYIEAQRGISKGRCQVNRHCRFVIGQNLANQQKYP